MGKRKKNKKNGNYRSSTDDDRLTSHTKSDENDDFESTDENKNINQCDIEQSLTALSIHCCHNDTPDHIIIDKVDTILDNISDKREIIRMQAFQQITFLLLDICGREELLVNRAETIFDVLTQIFKRGHGVKSKILVCRPLLAYGALLANSTLLDNESTFEQLCSALMHSVGNVDEDSNIRKSYMTLLCAYQLLGIADECLLRKRELISHIENIFLECRLGGTLETLQESAISQWSILISLALDDDHKFAVASIERFLSKASSLLQCDFLTIRFAAGQAVALIAELTRQDTRINFVVSKELEDVIQELSNYSGKNQAKRELLSQREHFRNIDKSISSRCYSEEAIKLGKLQLIINSWKVKCYYDFLVKILSNSFYKHLQYNTAVQQLLNYDDSTTADQSCQNSQQYRKWAEKDRQRSRDIRRDAKRTLFNDLYV